MIRLPLWLSRTLDFLTQAALVIAAGVCAACTLAPWANVTIFRTVDLHIPGAIFPDGMYAVSAATAATLLRRSRLVGIAAALLCRWTVLQASLDIPTAVIKNMVAAQMNLFSVNSILDQAHLQNLTVGNWSLPRESYLDYGIGYTLDAANWLLIAAAAGLFFDPVVVYLWQRFGALPCRQCRKWIAVRRRAAYCPRCGLWLARAPEPLRCRGCRSVLTARDNYCSMCGFAVAVSPAEALAL